ncbi:potassium channel family protein [Nocardia gamkensis]|uniref:potassium channel family protein n=1 Tax=Nocardia gamkensis TaxID=352869 RepID=UPI0037C93088
MSESRLDVLGHIRCGDIGARSGSRAGGLDGLRTRTDSLYYTIVTLGTVGHGDVHAVRPAAKVATMVQVVFDLGVIGTLIAIGTSRVVQRLDEARREPPPGGAV